MATTPHFKNRMQAGKQLAMALHPHVHAADTLVLALPRGGVPVGFAVSRTLALELDILLVRKLGLPGHEEFAMGAIGSGGVRILNADVMARHHVSHSELERICARELGEIARRERQYRGARAPPQLAGRSLILVDDGLATGSTMRAAIALVRAQQPARIVVAAPTGASDTCASLALEVDALVCLHQPAMFRAVSQWYRHFEQTDDDEVRDLLARAWRKETEQSAGFSERQQFSGGSHKHLSASR